MGRDDPGTARLLADLDDRIEGCLGSLLGGAERVAYVNYPNHGNAGDPALWLGGLRTLDRLGLRVVYHCAPDTYDAQRLQRARPDAIVINGGGNLGDRYPRQQKGREAVLRDFPDVRTVQLPQSVSFSDRHALERMQRLVADHRDLTLLLRDQRSLDRAQRWFEAPTHRCPDLAFALGPRSRTDQPRHAVLWLARGDREATGEPPRTDGLDAHVTDWLGQIDDEPPWSRPARAARWLDQRSRRQTHTGALTGKWQQPMVAATYRQLAEARVLRGMRILARGQIVVTDRLHGHVLALLQGIPHVVLDNVDGKVRAVYEADTHRSPLVHFAQDAEHAAEIARALLAQR